MIAILMILALTVTCVCAFISGYCLGRIHEEERWKKALEDKFPEAVQPDA